MRYITYLSCTPETNSKGRSSYKRMQILGKKKGIEKDGVLKLLNDDFLPPSISFPTLFLPSHIEFL